MDSLPPVVADGPDPRTPIPTMAGERETLDAWLDTYRQTVLVKIAGLDADALALRAVPPSTLSLIGLVRHLYEVEVYWLHEVLLGKDVPDVFSTPERPDGCFDDASADTAAADVDVYRGAVESTRRAAETWLDLDAPSKGLSDGEAVSLRWILTHMIEEYARHLGHMDLLREAVDGRTGY